MLMGMGELDDLARHGRRKNLDGWLTITLLHAERKSKRRLQGHVPNVRNAASPARLKASRHVDMRARVGEKKILDFVRGRVDGRFSRSRRISDHPSAFATTAIFRVAMPIAVSTIRRTWSSPSS
jgi:hypothetical protein